MGTTVSKGAEVRWASYGSYSGPMVSGGLPLAVPTATASHIERAYWLTAKVETGGMIGKVIAYDGTCMTAGPDQHIAVYPKELASEDYYADDDQGSLWKLLRKLEETIGTGVNALLAELRSQNLYLSAAGRVLYLEDADPVISGKRKVVTAGSVAHGNYIRDTWTGPGGQVSKSGPRWDKAARWALLWHNVTMDPRGHRAQIDFGMDHLVDRSTRRTLIVAGQKRDVERVLYGDQQIREVRVDPTYFPIEVDLASCVFHANSVNGPAPALRALQAAANLHSPQRQPQFFARRLIEMLGNNGYGRWDDDIPSGRYDRTRTHARASGLWPRELFDGPTAIMPKDLPG